MQRPISRVVRAIGLVATTCVIFLTGTSFGVCAGNSTSLLFTFVTSQAGFDTGLFIANSTESPLLTTPIDGTCTLSFFGTNAPVPLTTGTIEAGTVYANVASSVAPNFQGYVIAVCGFPGASGGSFVSDLGATTLAAGYAAQVLPTPGDLADTEESRDLEEALLLRRPIASLYLPAAQGGKLETIDSFVQDVIARVVASGESTNGAAQNLGYAHTAQSLGKFKEAFAQYSAAYCRAVSPVSKLSQCN